MKRENSAGQTLTLAAVCLMLGAVPLAIVPFPFLFPQAIYEYSLWPKAIVLHLCIALGVVGWMIQSRLGTEADFVHNRLTLPLVCFLGIAAASFSTPHPIDSLFELFNLAALIVLYLVVSNTLSSSGLRSVLWANAIAGLLVSFVGILQYQDIVFLNIPSNGLPSATFGYRNFAAMYLICTLPLSVLMFLMVSRLPALLVSGLSATLMGVFLVYTRTRGAWLGIAIGLMAVGMVALHLREAKPGAFRLYRLVLGAGWSSAALALYICAGIPLLLVLIAAVPGWVIIAESLSHIAGKMRIPLLALPVSDEHNRWFLGNPMRVGPDCNERVF